MGRSRRPTAGGHPASTQKRTLTAEVKADLLFEIARRSRRTLDLGETLDLLLDALASVVDYDAAGIFALNEDLYPTAEQRPAGMIAGVAHRGFLERPLADDRMLSSGLGLVGEAIRSGRRISVPDVREHPGYVVGRRETRSEIVVPIAVDGRTIAALNLESDRLAAFGEADTELLDFFAEAAGLAIERAQLHHQLLAKEQLDAQLRLAREVQTSLLPEEAPSLPGYDIAGLCLPSLELGGDAFDYLPLSDGRLGVAISDVVGKGVPAALIMATVRALLRARHRAAGDLAAIVGDVGRLLRETAPSRSFATCVYTVLEPTSGRLEYASCGHPVAILQRADGTFAELENCGPALGAFELATYTQRAVTLAPRDRLLLYTDGLIEATDPDGEQFGAERLRVALRETRTLDARDTLDALVSRVRAFVASSHLADDLTLVLMKRLWGTDADHAVTSPDSPLRAAPRRGPTTVDGD